MARADEWSGRIRLCMDPDRSTHSPHRSEPEEELPPLRRSFPVPRRREAPVSEEPVPLWQHWAIRGMLAAAMLMAGTAAWIKLRPDNTAPPVITGPEAPQPGPPDAARDIYFDIQSREATGPPPVVAEIPPVEIPPAPGHSLTDLDARYLGALTAAMKHVPSPDRAQFTAEIERLCSGVPLPPPQDGIHPELARLQSIYRLQLLKGNPP